MEDSSKYPEKMGKFSHDKLHCKKVWNSFDEKTKYTLQERTLSPLRDFDN